MHWLCRNAGILWHLKSLIFFLNYTHFALTVGCTYECSWMCSVFESKGLQGKYTWHRLFSGGVAQKGLVGHLQPCHDLCVCRGLILQQMPLPLLALSTLPPVCEHIPAGGLEGCGGLDARRGKIRLPVCCETQLARPHPKQHNQSSHWNFINFILGRAARETTLAELAKKIWTWPCFMWPSGFNGQVSLLCCHQRHFHFYSYSFCLPSVKRMRSLFSLFMTFHVTS